MTKSKVILDLVDEARAQLVEGAKHVERQREAVGRLERGGQERMDTKELLVTIEDMRKRRIARCDRLEKALTRSSKSR